MDSDHPHPISHDETRSEALAAPRPATLGARPARAGSAAPMRVASRYRALGEIGRGGLGVVYRALDEGTGATVALKVLHTPLTNEAARALFEGEYHTLRQLAHPSVIEVHDYGLDDDGRPYYTMELLSGQDLRELAPLPFREVCQLLMPVASSLAVLHSRRLLHRDVSARNVRRTEDGRAKLIDFGALGTMGVAQPIMGTPPYLAPEAVHGQPLDARTDLYAFGALLYFMLTGRHAYPARRIAELRDWWRSPIPSPRRLDASIPEALGNLVTALLSLDPSARPTSAAEVMVRLGSIAGLTLEEDAAVHRAYLTTPKLVARDSQLLRVRKLLLRTRRGRGGTLYVEAAPGTGRSRMLDACVLEAKLVGAIVARAGIGEASGGRFGVARALLQQVRDAVPDAAAPPDLESDAGDADREALQVALRHWFLTVTRTRPLSLVVDDYHGIDEASAALLATLGDDADQHRLALIVSAQQGATHAAPMAWEVLTRRATALTLEPLSSEQAEELLISMFGDVPHVRLLAARLHAAARGNPRTLMELAEQLVDADRVRYEAGNWVLPDTLEEMTPESAIEHARAQVDALSPRARRLALGMALAPDLAFERAECAQLYGTGGAADAADAELFGIVEELAQARIITRKDALQRLAHDGYRQVLQGATDDVRAAHERLAQVLEARGSRPRAAVHWMAADAPARAVRNLVAVGERSLRGTGEPEASLVLRASDAYRDTLAAAVDATDDARERLLLRLLIIELGAHAGPALLKEHLPPLLRRLCLDCGLERATATHDDASVLSRTEALPLLPRVCLTAGQSAVRWFDAEVMALLPSLEPLVELSPSFWITQQLIDAYGHIIRGRFHACRACYQRVLDRLAEPDGAGLDAAARRRAELGARAGLALVVATWSLPEALAHAEKLDAAPEGRVLACHIRSTYHLGRGASERAEYWQRQAELLEIQRAPTELTARRHVYPQLVVSAYSQDLLGVKQALARIPEMAARAPGWEPILQFAQAAYDHIRGDREAAGAGYASLLEQVGSGTHLNWPLVSELHLQVLVELGMLSEAIAQGEPLLALCLRDELPAYLVKPLAIAHAKLGNHDKAAELADSDVASWEALGGTGLYIGRGYETRARVAIYAGDQEAFDRNAALCAQHFLAGSHPGLRAMYERLLEEARAHDMGPVAAPEPGTLDPDDDSEDRSMVQALLAECSGAHERNAKVLELLLDRAGAREGALFGVGARGVEQLASTCYTPKGMEAFVETYLGAEVEDSGTVTLSTANPEDLDVFASEHGRYHPLVLRVTQQRDEVVVGIAMLSGDDGAPRELPVTLLRAIANAMLEHGDVASLPAAN